MIVADHLTATCWCGRTEVEIPVDLVRSGKTLPCSATGCGPGCEMVTDSDDEYDEPPYERRIWKMNKFDPSRYDTRDDSTQGLPVRNDAVSLIVGDGMCGCGCGDAVSGTKAKFCMGHDARLKGMLVRAAAAQVNVALYDGDPGGTLRVITPLEYAAEFSTPKVDWQRLVTDGVEKISERRGPIDRRVSERRVLQRATEDGAIRIGRWDKTGSVAAIYRTTGGKYEVEYVDEVGRIRQTEVEVA